MTSHLAHLVRGLARFFRRRKLPLNLPADIGQRFHSQSQASANTNLGALAGIGNGAAERQCNSAVWKDAYLGHEIYNQDRDGSRFGYLKAGIAQQQELLSSQRINLGHQFLPSEFNQSFARFMDGVER